MKFGNDERGLEFCRNLIKAPWVFIIGFLKTYMNQIIGFLKTYMNQIIGFLKTYMNQIIGFLKTYMNPVFGVIGPGFLNQVPTLLLHSLPAPYRVREFPKSSVGVSGFRATGYSVLGFGVLQGFRV